MAAAASAVPVSPLEATRISALLDDTIEKLNFLSVITPDILKHKDEVAELTSSEIQRLINEQRALETRFQELIQIRSSLEGGNKNRYKEIQSEIASLSYQLRESVKNLCTSFEENPDLGETVARIAEERENLISLLEKTHTNLREGHYSALVSFVDREHETRAKLKAVASKEEEVMREVDNLTALLKEEEEKHAAEMEAKRLELTDLKEKLRKLKVDTTLTLRYARKEASSKTEAGVRQFNAEETDILAEIEKIRKKIETERGINEQTLELLKREQDIYTKQTEEWKLKQAAELEAKSTELQALTAERERQRLALEGYRARYDKDLAELQEAEAAEEAKRAAAEAAKAEEERRQAAATAIQTVLGDMFALVAAAGAGAGGKAAKGGDKKKGKKK